MLNVSMKYLLEAGVHFGHQTNRWNPKMKPYIFGARNGIYIIDLQKTLRFFRKAYDFIVETVSQGNSVLFVGTKKQAVECIKEETERCGMFYVNHRWLGGMLTNFATIRKNVERLKEIEAMKAQGSFDNFSKKEILTIEKEWTKLDKKFGGIKEMNKLPGVVCVVDPRKEKITVAEAKKLGIPIVGLIDTNGDPDDLDYIVPGNDDAIRAVRLFVSKISDACVEGDKLLEKKRLAEKGEEGSDSPDKDE